MLLDLYVEMITKFNKMTNFKTFTKHFLHINESLIVLQRKSVNNGI